MNNPQGQATVQKELNKTRPPEVGEPVPDVKHLWNVYQNQKSQTQEQNSIYFCLLS